MALSDRNGHAKVRPMKVLGIDIGGSAVKGAPVETTTGRLLAERFKIETPVQLSPDEMANTRRRE